MKTFAIKPLLLFVLLGISFANCSNDDDADAPNDEAGNQELLIGKWFFEKSSADDDITDCEKTGYLDLNDKGEAYVILYADSTQGCVPLAEGNYEYEMLSEETVKFIYRGDGEGEDFNAEILSIGESELVLKDFIFPDGVITFRK